MPQNLNNSNIVSDHYKAISIGRFSSKTNLEKTHDALIILLYVKLTFLQPQRTYFTKQKKTPQEISFEREF